MRSMFLTLIIGIAFVDSSRAYKTCRIQPEKCEGQTCCVEFGPVGRCRPLLEEGNECELSPIMSKQHKHVHILICSCGEGLSCQEDGSGSTVQGRCVAEA